MVGVGLGAFADGILFHQVLQWHRIRPGEDALLYDAGYTAVGVALALVGLRLVRSGHDRALARP